MPSLQKLVENDKIDLKRSLLNLSDKHIKPLNIKLLDRAKLFLKVIYQERQAEKGLRQFASQIKFKSGRNFNLNDQTLPPKSQLIQICRQQLAIEHTQVIENMMLAGLPSKKDQMIIFIFIYHVVIPQDHWYKPRASIFEYIG